MTTPDVIEEGLRARAAGNLDGLERLRCVAGSVAG